MFIINVAYFGWSGHFAKWLLLRYDTLGNLLYEPKIGVREPSKPAESESSRRRGLRDIRRRIWKRSDLKTGSGRGSSDFRSVPEVDPVDPRVPLRSQVASSHRFRDIAFSALGFPPLLG